jgi:hypothetical protein
MDLVPWAIRRSKASKLKVRLEPVLDFVDRVPRAV